ncbi:autotransporter domain-containing protein [Synechococcus sp. 8F6]|uniref:autotransporter domain-containing protein n=1 Tax=Synechococcus sp. 8F6 TaxID=2025606 RepID=UPI001303CF5A|nr:autotransporter domain-containing protein [Synechococcus sp. 8F6]
MEDTLDDNSGDKLRFLYIRTFANLFKTGVIGITPFLIAFETKAKYYCSADTACEANTNNQTLMVTYIGTKGIKNLGFKGLKIDISGRISGYMFSNPSIYGIYQPNGYSWSAGYSQPYLSDTDLINNEGFIYGTTFAIYNGPSQKIGTIENKSNATISGYYGIDNGGSIDTINNAVNGNLLGRYVAVSNTGTIAKIDNRGSIEGLTPAWLGSDGIFNIGTITSLKNFSSGTISGSGAYGYGVSNSGTITTLENLAGGSITGAVALQNSNSGVIGSLKNSGLISSTSPYGAGVSNSGSITSIENNEGGTISGSISNNTGGKINSIANSGSITKSITNYGDITTVDNSGSITGTISNYGTISEITNNGSLENKSNATISGYYGIDNGGSIDTINNAVNGNLLGRYVAVSNTGTIAKIDNRGSIEGLTPAWLGSSGIFNIGTITSLKNFSSGTISGSRAYGYGVSNSGTITTLENLAGGSITGAVALQNSNSGVIGSLKNSGLISSTSPYGAGISNSGSITSIENNEGGTISGSISNNTGGKINSIANSGSITKSITNYGDITTVDNSGSITGTISNYGTISEITNNGSLAGIYSYGGALGQITNNGSIISSIDVRGQDLRISGGNGNISGYSISVDTGKTIYFSGPGQTISSSIYGNFDIASGTSLTFIGSPNSYSSFDGKISGSGQINLKKSGDEKATEYANYNFTGMSSYTGIAIVESGVSLINSGSLATGSLLTVNPGAVVGGNGIFPTTKIKAGAGIVPFEIDNNNNFKDATLKIAGNLVLEDLSTTQISVYRTSSSNLDVTGTAAISGNLSLVFLDSAYDSSKIYTLFSANSVSGNFTSTTGSLTGYAYDLIYGSKDVKLSLYKVVPPGTTTDASNPSSTILNGGTIKVDAPGTFSTDFTLSTGGGVIDANGLTSNFSGIFRGAGELTFTNSSAGQSGTTYLSGSSPDFTGTIAVASGAKVLVNGSIANSNGLNVAAGGELLGTGTLPTTSIQTGAKHSPGNSIGLQSVNGNYGLSGGTISIELQGPKNDKISATGNVTAFTGTATLIPYGGGSPWPNFDYQLITATNNFATNSSLTLDQSGVNSALLNYGTNLVQEADGNATTFDVQWQPKNRFGATASAVSSLGKGQRNQLATAGAFDRVFSSLATAAGNQSGTTTGVNATGTSIGTTGFTTGQAAAAGISSDFLTTTSQLLALTSGSQLTAAIDSLSPEPYAAYQAVGLSTLKRQRDLLFSQAGNCQINGWTINAPETKKGKIPKHPVCVFAQANNATSSIRGQDGLSSYNSGVFSSFYGLEYQASKQWSVGAAYGYGTSNLSNMSLTSANVSSDVNGGALYAVYKPAERWNIKALLGYSSFGIDGSRNVAYIGNGSTINGRTSAIGYTAAINASYDIPIKVGKGKLPMLLKPIAGLAWGGYQQSGFTESDGGALNLRVNGNTANSLVGTLGLEVASSPITLSKNKVQSITPRLAVAYQVDALANTSGNKSLTSSFVDAPDAGSFSTQGENGGANAFIVAGGFDLQVAKNVSIYAMASYELQTNGSQFGYGGGVKIIF